MSGEKNKLISQDIRKDHDKEAAEENKAFSQDGNEIVKVDDEFEEARAEENAFDAARA